MESAIFWMNKREEVKSCESFVHIISIRIFQLKERRDSI